MNTISSLIDQYHSVLPSELAVQWHDDPDAAIAWLDQQISTVRRFVPAPIVRHLVHADHHGGIHGAVWHGSLLFADLSGFTALSEHLASLGKEGSEEITRVINRLFSALVEQIERHGGDLIKFGGDALTAFFDADVLGDHHAVWATGAALEMQRRMLDIGKVDTRLGSFDLRLRIGVHSGTAFAAMLGDTNHQELLLTGDDVNHVALAQEIAAPGEVVCSAATLAYLKHARSEARDDGFEAILAAAIPPLPQLHDTLNLPPIHDTIQQLEQRLRLYAGLRLFLPQRLTESQLLGNDQSAAGEFRLVTVLFAHIAPFSYVIKHFHGDPATITPLLNRYYERMQRIVNHYGGVVNKLDMAADGDKLLAIFGAPIANENDAELAVRAGMEMQEALNEINAILHQTDPRLPMLDQQIGINQGHVFAGLVGSARRIEYTVMGDPVNTAARLMSKCEAGCVMVSPAVQRITKNIFAYEALPPIPLKGKSQPIEPFRVDRTYNVRRDVIHARLIGRDDELDQLRERSIAALNGAGQAMMVVGEAGIGKSRLLEETLQWLTLASLDPNNNVPEFTPITIECQFYEQTTPYASANEIMRQVLRVRGGISEADLVAHVQQRVSKIDPDLERFTPLLRDVLHIPLPETPLTESLTPEQRHERLLELLVGLIFGTSRQMPIVLFWDDVHWIDASSYALLAELLAKVDDQPLLLLLGARPEAQARFANQTQLTILQLHELNDHDRVVLASSLIGDEPLPKALLERWQRGDENFFNPQGNPFFIEEMMRSLLEQGVIVETPDGWVLTGNMDALPTTIEGVITARLDRLEARIRETVQIASVVGRRFQMAVLNGLSDSNDLPHHMDTLTAADLVLPETLAVDLAYLFKHTLTRDVAYEGILYVRRRELHRRVAARLRELHGHESEEVLPILARHYARAEEWSDAVHYYLLAGRAAQKSYANTEAIAHYSSAIEMLRQLPHADHGLALELHERLGYVQLQAGDYANAIQSLQTARSLIQEHDPLQDSARILRHMATAHERRAEYDQAFAMIHTGLKLLEHEPDSDEKVGLLLSGAVLHHRQGRYNDTIEWSNNALNVAKQIQHMRHQAYAYKILAAAHYNLGQKDQAIEFLRNAIHFYDQAHDMLGLTSCYSNISLYLSDLHQWDEALDLAQKGYTIAQSTNDIYNQACIINNIGDIYRKQHDFDQALESFLANIELWRKLDSKYGTAITYTNLGAIYLELRDYAQSLHYLDACIALYREIGTDEFLPEVYRYYAQIYQDQGDYTKAVAYIHQSLDVARQLQATYEEGLTLLLYTGIMQQQGDLQLAYKIAKQALVLLEKSEIEADCIRCLDYLIPLSHQIAPHETTRLLERRQHFESIAHFK